MNIAKNMEAIFFAAIALAGATSLATAAVPARHAPAAIAAPATIAALADPAPEGRMQVVTVTAKRLTAAEKAALAP